MLATPASVRAAVAVNLSLTVNTVNKTYQAFGSVSDSLSETLGLHGLEFDVTGSGGVVVTGSTVLLPQPTETLDFATFYQKGFNQLRSNGSAGQDIRAFQQNSNQLSTTGSGNNNILENVGEMVFTETNGALAATIVTSAVLIASGSYTGTFGQLTISGSPALTTLLPATLPPATAGGAAFSTFSPSSVTGQAVAIPEPTSIATLAVAGLLLFRRRFARSAM